jgi:hypothetical protein
MADFKFKMSTNMQNNNLEAENEDDVTSDYESTPRLLESRSCILFDQKYDFYYRSFLFVYIHFLYSSTYLFNAEIFVLKLFRLYMIQCGGFSIHLFQT